MTRVQRRMAMRIVSTYSTISTEASQILADVPPIDLMALDKREIYVNKNNIELQIDAVQTARSKLILEW